MAESARLDAPTLRPRNTLNEKLVLEELRTLQQDDQIGSVSSECEGKEPNAEQRERTNYFEPF